MFNYFHAFTHSSILLTILFIDLLIHPFPDESHLVLEEQHFSLPCVLDLLYVPNRKTSPIVNINVVLG